ncbi:hypothetical protein CROQUDRAFT_103111 [Cronartium quercuum f. sp. fusiforme G11]|uniref:Uncharacterized protein n=1 Tax=Cronartium quercuum f. sp. fusiforme G11 TaxID=708437 RepID=A0A9P6NZ29_9BASI|nr:hypothetical protein CROQUDRAFT_103111 [Cronartium quercuum f. sp. fusiforme G11]
MDIDHIAPSATGQPTDGTSPVILLLNRGDQLTQAFQKVYNDSITHVQTLKSAEQQCVNLANLPARNSLASVTVQYPSMRERTMATLQQTVEEAQAGIRTSLDSLERILDELSQLLFSVDVYLADPKLVGSTGFNPTSALQHLSALFSAHQAELLSKRELFSSYNCEEIGVDELLSRWRVCDELKGLNKETMDDLADVMGTWST